MTCSLSKSYFGSKPTLSNFLVMEKKKHFVFWCPLMANFLVGPLLQFFLLDFIWHGCPIKTLKNMVVISKGCHCYTKRTIFFHITSNIVLECLKPRLIIVFLTFPNSKCLDPSICWPLKTTTLVYLLWINGSQAPSMVGNEKIWENDD